jgi:hypothetical protein
VENLLMNRGLAVHVLSLRIFFDEVTNDPAHTPDRGAASHRLSLAPVAPATRISRRGGGSPPL